MKLSERVQYVVDNLPISASAWSLKAGKSRGYAQKLLERDAVRPDAAALRKMAEVVGVPREWFVDGEGDPPSLGGQARNELRVERDPAPIVKTPPDASPLVQAVSQSFDKNRHLITDASAVIDTLHNRIDTHQKEGIDLVEKARVWLDAAAALRREGKTVDAATLLDRVTLGKSPRLKPDEEDAFQREIAELAAKHGVTFGDAVYAVEEFKRRGREADERAKKGGGS